MSGSVSAAGCVRVCVCVERRRVRCWGVGAVLLVLGPAAAAAAALAALAETPQPDKQPPVGT